jgi:hypothetical protein
MRRKVQAWATTARATSVSRMMKNRVGRGPVGGSGSRSRLAMRCGMRLQTPLARSTSNWFPALRSTTTAPVQPEDLDRQQDRPSHGGLAAAQGSANVDVMRMDFLPNWTISGDHAPYYVALEKGWCDEVALEVNIILRQGSGVTVQSVDTDRAHMGIADAPVAVAGHAGGASVMIVGIIFGPANT